MIIFVIGTSGSGKSTLARLLLEELNEPMPQYVDGRKQPLYYRSLDPVVVVGHYNAPCGGADTLHSFAEVYAVVDKAEKEEGNVFVEGLLLVSSWRWMLDRYMANVDVRVVALTEVPVEECIASVLQRRKAKAESVGGTMKDVGPNFYKNIASKARDVSRTADRLETEGVTVYRTGRDGALDYILESFGVT